MRRIPALLLMTVIAIPIVSLATQRSEIDDLYKWKPEHIYLSLEPWEADMQAIRANIDRLAAFKGRFSGPEAKDPVRDLIAYNRLAEETEAMMERVASYVYYNFHVNMGNSDWVGRQQRISDLFNLLGQKLSWAEPELLTVPRSTLLQWVDQNPELHSYRIRYEDMYTLQEHTLSEQEERILALAGKVTGTTGDVFGKFTDVDMRFGYIKDEKGDTIEVTDTGWTSWRVHPDRRVREDYFKAVWNEYDKYGNTFAALMAGNVKKDVFLAQARNYRSTLERALKQSFIPEEVYVNLVNTTRKNTAPLHRYDAIRKRILGVDHYRHWDYYVSLVDEDEQRYTWEQGVEMVADALRPLGEQLVGDVRMALDPRNGWVDVYASQGKRGGAYSSSTYGVHPYMLYNFDWEKGLTLDDVSTVAHEVGHSIHTYYSEKAQPFPMRDYAIFNAEVASTTKETLFSMKALDEARVAYAQAEGAGRQKAKNRLIYLLEQNINSARDTYYRQVMFATWEWEAHKLGEEGKPMTRDSFNKIYSDLLKEWHGDAAGYEPLSGNSWSHVPHFYRGYYVYAYATSYAAAVALARDIRAEAGGDASKRGARDRYLAYLASGGSKHPVELLQDAGVDMTTPRPIESFIAYFAELVGELDALTAKP